MKNRNNAFVNAIVAVNSATKDELIKQLELGAIEFDKDSKKEELARILIAEIVAKQTAKDIVDEQSTKEQLELRGKQILESATKHNNTLSSLITADERKAYLDVITKENGPEMRNFIENTFPNLLTPETFVTTSDKGVRSTRSVTPTTDLPVSQIFTKLPMRVVNEFVNNITVEYELMNQDIIITKLLANGIEDIYYKDYRDVGNKSGYSDVAISDYNMGIEHQYKEVAKVDTEISKGYDILSTLLNDVTLSVGMFVAIFADFELAIARPYAKKFYSRFVTFLGTDETYDQIITNPKGSTVKAKAQSIYDTMITLQTASRNHLKKLPKGASTALEYKLSPENTVLILNKKFASSYKYDLTAGTYQLAEIKLPVGKIVVKDFAEIDAYIDKTKITADGHKYGLQAMDAILIERGIYERIVHYQAQKLNDTPKMKTVFNRYDRVGAYRRKDKIAIAFKEATA